MSTTEAAAAAPPEGGRSLSSQLAGVAAYVEELRRSGRRGDLAELRRLDPGGKRVPPEVFWRIVERYEIPVRDEPFWQVLLPLMVRHPHQQDAMPGRVLYRAGISDARLERWLRQDAAGALREAGRLLSKVDEPLDMVRLGYLLYFWDHPEHGERNRRSLARDFFLAPERRVPSSNGAE